MTNLMIKPCTSPQQPGWLELRQALWPHDDDSEHLDEMSRFCAEPERFGQLIAVAGDGTAQGFIEIATVAALRLRRMRRLTTPQATRCIVRWVLPKRSASFSFAKCLRPIEAR